MAFNGVENGGEMFDFLCGLSQPSMSGVTVNG